MTYTLRRTSGERWPFALYKGEELVCIIPTEGYRVAQHYMERIMTIYKEEDKIPLSQIIPGDTVRFETKYMRPQTDRVDLIIPLEDDNLRSRAFCDPRKHVINHFPDQVTDAFLVERSPERDALDEIERAEIEAATAAHDAAEAKMDKAFETFKSLSRGSVFSLDLGVGWIFYTKLKKNRWSAVETLADGDAQLTHEDDFEVFQQLYNPESGNCYGLMNGRPVE
jgi:hypothetical protein